MVALLLVVVTHRGTSHRTEGAILALTLIEQAEQYLAQTTIGYVAWYRNVQGGKYVPADGSETNWGKALALLNQANATTTTTTATTTTAPTTTTGTTTTTPAGAVAFSDGFEAGNLNLWSQKQCLNYGYASNTEFTRGNAFADGGVSAKGAYSLRVDLPASSNKSACELAQGPYQNGVGTDTWYSVESLFPSNWVEPSGWGATITQLHFQYPVIWAGPWQLVAHADRVEGALQSGRCAYGTGCATNLKPVVVPVGKLVPGGWLQIIMHLHWATDNTGVVEAWWRPRGGTWAQSVNLTGVPTMQVDLNGTLLSTSTYDKLGFYRGAATFPMSVWHDNFCRADSFAAAESCF